MLVLVVLASLAVHPSMQDALGTIMVTLTSTATEELDEEEMEKAEEDPVIPDQPPQPMANVPTLAKI